ncbi:MAG: hypothetical protein K2W96_19725 [Gemmataceae bacterium]|nr:hypothetical protein [Gemmataceae bacterium]
MNGILAALMILAGDHGRDDRYHRELLSGKAHKEAKDAISERATRAYWEGYADGRRRVLAEVRSFDREERLARNFAYEAQARRDVERSYWRGLRDGWKQPVGKVSASDLLLKARQDAEKAKAVRRKHADEEFRRLMEKAKARMR